MSPSLILISASLFTWGVGEGMFLYFQPIYLKELGASTMMIAGVFSAFGLAMTVAHIPAGYLADRIGRRPLIWAAWGCGLISAWMMALARTLPAFIFGMLCYGLTAFVSSPLNSYVTAARGRLSTARAMTLTSAAFNLGAVIGPVSGGWIGDHFGLQRVYLVAACIFVASTAILLFLRPQPTDNHDPESPPAKLLTNRRYLGFLGVAFISVFVMYLPQPFTPKFLEEARGLSLGTIGLMGSIGSAGNVLMNLLLGQFNARTGFIVAQLAVGAFAFLLWRGTNVIWFGLGYFMLGGYRTARVLISAQVRPLIHKAQMGLAYGITETVNSFSIILAPLLAGYLYTRDPVSLYPVTLALSGVAVGMAILFAPREKTKPEAVQVNHPSDI